MDIRKSIIGGRSILANNIAKAMSDEDLEKGKKEGMVAKKVTITRGGKTFTKTVYVKPGEESKKSDGHPVGHIHEQDGKRYKKQENGNWLQVSEYGMTKKEHKEKSEHHNMRSSVNPNKVQSDIDYRDGQHHEQVASKLSDKEHTDEEIGLGEKKSGEKSSSKSKDGGEFNLISGNSPVKSYKYGDVVVTIGGSRDQIVENAGKGLGVQTNKAHMSGGKMMGHSLQHEHMYHYNIASIDDRITVSSKEPMEPSQTRPIASKFLEFEESSHTIDESKPVEHIHSKIKEEYMDRINGRARWYIKEGVYDKDTIDGVVEDIVNNNINKIKNLKGKELSAAYSNIMNKVIIGVDRLHNITERKTRSEVYKEEWTEGSKVDYRKGKSGIVKKNDGKGTGFVVTGEDGKDYEVQYESAERRDIESGKIGRYDLVKKAFKKTISREGINNKK